MPHVSPVRYDATIVGAGPNGLAAAIVLASAGHSVVVFEAQQTIGGAARSAPLTLTGFVHDHCSAIHPLARASPFLRTLPLERHGLTWIDPPVPLAHPLGEGQAALLFRSVDETASALEGDGRAWRRLLGPISAGFSRLLEDVLAPLRFPRHPLALGRFGLHALRSARSLARAQFRGEPARALFAGNAAHAMVPLEKAATAAFALVLAGCGHAVGWPLPRGGAQKIADALASHLRDLGGEIRTGHPISRLEELPPSRLTLLDLTPRNVLRVAGDRFPPAFQRRLSRFRLGPAAFKVDWALSAPIPWSAPTCYRAGTVHLGGTLDEVAAALRAPWAGRVPEIPFVLLSQPTLFDPARAPAGQHIAWAYCQVPNGCTVDMCAAIEDQVERFAPGFRSRILARRATSPRELERENANLVGGDIAGGAQDLSQLFVRPTLRLYGTPDPRIIMCSSSTPPGAGVHGMCGFAAAQVALRRLRGGRV